MNPWTKMKKPKTYESREPGRNVRKTQNKRSKMPSADRRKLYYAPTRSSASVQQPSSPPLLISRYHRATAMLAHLSIVVLRPTTLLSQLVFVFCASVSWFLIPPPSNRLGAVPTPYKELLITFMTFWFLQFQSTYFLISPISKYIFYHLRF